MLDTFKEIFYIIQKAVAEKNQQVIHDYCTPEEEAHLNSCIADNNNHNVINVIENVNIDFAYILEERYDEDLEQPFVFVRFQFSMVDYYKDNLTGAIVEGSLEPIKVEETWVFTSANDRDWYLASIELD